MKISAPFASELGEQINSYQRAIKAVSDFQTKIGAKGYTIDALSNNISGFIFEKREDMKEFIDFCSVKSVVKDSGHRYFIASLDKYSERGRSLYRSLLRLNEIRKNNLRELNHYGLSQINFIPSEFEVTETGYTIYVNNIEVYATLLPYIDNTLVKN